MNRGYFVYRCFGLALSLSMSLTLMGANGPRCYEKIEPIRDHIFTQCGEDLLDRNNLDFYHSLVVLENSWTQEEHRLGYALALDPERCRFLPGRILALGDTTATVGMHYGYTYLEREIPHYALRAIDDGLPRFDYADSDVVFYDDGTYMISDINGGAALLSGYASYRGTGATYSTGEQHSLEWVYLSQLQPYSEASGEVMPHQPAEYIETLLEDCEVEVFSEGLAADDFAGEAPNYVLFINPLTCRPDLGLIRDLTATGALVEPAYGQRISEFELEGGAFFPYRALLPNHDGKPRRFADNDLVYYEGHCYYVPGIYGGIAHIARTGLPGSDPDADLFVYASELQPAREVVSTCD